ncbi:MAG: hypothetical protein ABIS50_06725 [Luteolibacter sp.]|uniref:hypothetical protein n=1 Tax=Luteolibacter sp. TaxID=1962973 RepID=UPI0032630A9D
MSFDSDDLPDAMQDSAGNLWIIVDGNWTIGLPASSDGAGGRSVVQGDFHERQWMICTGNGLERWDGRSDAPEVVVPGTPLNSAGSSLIANGKAFWVNSGPSDQETGLSDTSVEIVDLSTLRKTRADNPMELYPEQGGVHTRDNFFWKLGIGHGSELLTGLSRSNRASVWNTTTGKLVLHATDQNYTGLTASNISPDGRYLVLAEWNGRVSYYRAVLIVAGFDLIDLPLRMAHSANGLHIR